MELNTNALGHMIATIITEISKETGGLANLSRPSNSINNGQMGQPHVIMDLKGNKSHLHQNPEIKKLELNAALEVIKKTMKLTSAVPFNKPVDPVALGIPDYFDVVGTPMDFGTIRDNLKKGLKYRNASDVFKDVQWIWYNCLKYNKPGDQVLELMERVKAGFLKHWEAAGLETLAIVDDQEAKDGTSIRRRTKKQAPRLVVDENVQAKSKAKESTKVGKKKLNATATKANVVDGNKKNKGKEKMTKEIMKRKRMVREDDSELDEPRARKSKVNKGNKSVVREGPSVAKRHIRIRTSPKPLSTAMQSLSDLQKECLENLGFASFIRCRLDTIPWKLGYFVVDSFNEQKMEIKLKHGVIKVTKYSVFEMLGIALGGNPIESLGVPEEEDEIVANWRRQFDRKEMTTNEVMKKIVMSKEADWNFILNFLILFVNTMGQSFTRGKCDLSILRYITKDTELKKIDWCDYVYNCVKICKRGWKRDDENSFFAGPITLLTLLFVDNTVCKGLEVERSRPVLVHWSTELLKQREAVGNFWESKIAKQYIPSSELESMDNHDERREKESDNNLMEAEPCDVQVSSVEVQQSELALVPWTNEFLKQREAAGNFSEANIAKQYVQPSEVESVDNHDEQRGKESVNNVMEAKPCDVQVSSVEVQQSGPILVPWTTEFHKQREAEGNFSEAKIAEQYIQPSEVESMDNHDEQRGKESVDDLMEAEPSDVQVSSVEVQQSGPVLVHGMTEILKQREAAGNFSEAKIAKQHIQPSEVESMDNHDEKRGKESVNNLMKAEPCDVQVSSVEVQRSGPVLVHGMTDILKQREVGNLSEAKISKQHIQPSEVESMDNHDEQRGKEGVNNLMEAEPCDVQGYITIMETYFNSIISDKTQLLKMVKSAMSRFPDNSVLEDWDGKISMLDDVLKELQREFER